MPAFIGHPLHYPSDPYAAFLPPPGACDAMGDGPLRAVVIVREGQDDKDGQRYVSPIATLSGDEYEKITWIDMLARIEAAIREDA